MTSDAWLANTHKGVLPMLTREAILSADDLPRESLLIPEWGGDVWIRTLTQQERDEWEQQVRDQTWEDGAVGQAGLKSLLAILTLLDADGQRMFVSDDLPEFNQKSAAAVDRIWQVACRLNGLTEGDVEELAEN